MKNKQQEEAQNLYFQTNYSKTEIAEKVGVSRKTVLFWAHQGNWEKIRQSARTMPSLVAEKCYFLIDQYINSLLAEGRKVDAASLQLKNAQTIHLLATTIRKLKNRSTTNESMEMFNFFLDGLNRRDPMLAEQVAPQIEKYITIRNNADSRDNLTDEFSPDGTIPLTMAELVERYRDEQEYEALQADFTEFLKTRPEKTPEPFPDTENATTNNYNKFNEAA